MKKKKSETSNRIFRNNFRFKILQIDIIMLKSEHDLRIIVDLFN